jgi:hypothetical protein
LISDAANLTFGADLSPAPAGSFLCNTSACTFAQVGPSFVSPVTGAIVRWSVKGASGALALRVLSGITGGASGATQTPASTATQVFPAALPVAAGQRIGLDLAGNTSVGYTQQDSLDAWVSHLGNGETRSPFATVPNIQLLFNAEVQPAPAISALGPNTGPIGTSSPVVILGHDFAGATAVKFGSLPAAGFTINSEGEITAIPPPITTAGPVDVSVTTVAGTTPSSAADRFTFTASPAAPISACVVPKLIGRKLKASKKKLRARDCKLGAVTKKKGVTTRTGKVIKQSPRPGKVLAPGSRVSVKLGR